MREKDWPNPLHNSALRPELRRYLLEVEGMEDARLRAGMDRERWVREHLIFPYQCGVNEDGTPCRLWNVRN